MADDFDPDAYLADASPPDTGGEAPQQSFDPDQYIASFDPDAYLKDQQPRPQAEGQVKTFAREAAHGVLPSIGGFAAGAATGAGVGMLTANPIGIAAGALIGGFAGGYATDKVQETALDAAGFDDSQQRAANAEENPKSAFAGQLAPAVAMMRADKGATIAARTINAGLMGGVEAGQEKYNDGTISPGKVAAAAVAGAAFPTPNRVGQRVIGAGERFAHNVGARVPGRPGKQANPDAVPEQDAAQRAEDQPIVTGEVATEQSAPTVEADAVGNPQSAPDRSERDYGKGKAPAGSDADMLTQGDFTPDVAQALQGVTDPEAASIPRVAAENTWLGEDAPSPQPKDFNYTGTKPIDTGLVEAAAQQPRPKGWKKGTEAWAEQPPEAAPEPVQEPVAQQAPEQLPSFDEMPAAPPAAQQAINVSKANAGKPKLGLKNGVVPDVYHGTNRQFTDFDASKLQSASGSKDAKHGFYFTDDPEIASYFADNPKQGRIIRAKLGIKNPKTITLDPTSGLDKNQSIKEAFDAGHDAVIFHNSSEGKGPVTTTYVVKDPSQIEQRGEFRPGEEAAPANPIHDKIVEARDAVAHGDEITPEQAKADNYAQGHPGRMFGRMVTLETPKGGVRVDKQNNPPKYRNENYPTDYFKVLGTKGADGDHVDLHYVGTGDKHFVLDQRNLDTGKFDEHKVMAYAKDAEDAADHYDRGFSDGKGMDRVGALTEVSPEDLKAWLAKPGKKRTPFGETFKDGAAPQVEVPFEAARPKVVTAAVKAMREAGHMDDAAEAAFRAKSVGEQLKLANAYVNAGKTGRGGKITSPDRLNRIRTAPPVVEGIVDNNGKPITARSKGDAAAKSADVKTMNDAFEKYAPKEVSMPSTPEEKAALYDQMKAFLEETKGVKYRPNFKHAPYLLAREARKLTLAKKPSDTGWTSFVEALSQLRSGGEAEVRQGQRIEGDIARNTRGGDENIASAEAKNAQHDNVEDAMIRAIDAKRGYIDVPHEEAEDFVKPQKVESRADIKEPKGTIDITTPEGQTDFAKLLGTDVDETKVPAKAAKDAAAEKQAEIDQGRAKAASSIGTTDRAALNAKYAAMMETAQKKGASRHADQLEPLPPLPAEVKDLKPAAMDLFERFARDDRGEVNVNKIMGDLLDAFKGTAARFAKRTPSGAPAQPKPFLSKGKVSSFAKTPKSMQHELQHSLSNELHQIRQEDIEDKVQGLKYMNALPKGMDEGARERIYFAREAGKINALSPADKALYDEHIKPVLDENDQLYDNIKAIDPSKVGPEVMDHISRLTKGEDADRNILKSGESSDPIEGVNAITTAQKGPLMDRRFVGLERQDGKRFVISLNDDGFNIWKDGKSQKVVDPTFKFEAGKKIKVGNNTFDMTEAMTPEIEAHAKMEGGAKAEYYHNAPLSAAVTNVYLKSMARHLQYLHNLKSDPVFKQFATNTGGAPAHWVETALPNFKGWKMDPQLAHVFDDFAQPGFNENSLNTLRRLSQAVTKTIFWMPTAHINNVGTHWFVERGWNWLPGTGGYRSLAVNGSKAIKSVIAQDGLQSELRANGAGTIYGGILTQGFMDQLGKAAGETIRKNPAKWDPIARVMGVGPSTLADAVYKGASKAMWAANDMLLTHAVLENMDLKGMSMPEAIRHAERHIPNYRVPPELITSGKIGRIISQIMQEPTLTAFGRYHYGVFNSYAHMVNDLVKGTGAERTQAVGNLFAMGLLAFAVYPALDKAWQALTDNPDATAQRRGPTAIPYHLARAAQGKEDPMQAARSTVTTSPLLTNVWETLTNRDFRGKSIVEPGDVRQAAQGSATAAGRVAVQEGEHAAKGLFSPLGTFSQGAAKGQSAAETLRDQALDIRNPSPQSRKFEANVPRTTTQQSRSRFKHPGGVLEGAFNKTFGY